MLTCHRTKASRAWKVVVQNELICCSALPTNDLSCQMKFPRYQLAPRKEPEDLLTDMRVAPIGHMSISVSFRKLLNIEVEFVDFELPHGRLGPVRASKPH